MFISIDITRAALQHRNYKLYRMKWAIIARYTYVPYRAYWQHIVDVKPEGHLSLKSNHHTKMCPPHFLCEYRNKTNSLQVWVTSNLRICCTLYRCQRFRRLAVGKLSPTLFDWLFAEQWRWLFAVLYLYLVREEVACARAEYLVTQAKHLVAEIFGRFWLL